MVGYLVTAATPVLSPSLPDFINDAVARETGMIEFDIKQ